MPTHGIRPTAPNKKQLSFPLTFGTVPTTDYMPLEFDVDAHLTMPDQMAAGRPYGCSGYTVVEIATNEDGVIYDPGYPYDKARELEGVKGQDVGVELKDAFKCATVYGLIPQAGGLPADHRAPYYEVHPAGGFDMFDSIRSAMVTAKHNDNKNHCVGFGTFWLRQWAVPQAGIITDVYTYDGDPSRYNWHAFACVGWVFLNGEQFLKCKTWQGANYGDGGYCYFSRPLINKIFNEWGTIALMQIDAKPEDAQRVRLTTIELTIHYIMQIIKKGGLNYAFEDLVALLKLINV